jgi:hypothetical protein
MEQAFQNSKPFDSPALVSSCTDTFRFAFSQVHLVAWPQKSVLTLKPQAAMRVSGLELGGLVGSLIAGRLSDAMIRNDKTGTSGAVGKRVQARYHQAHQCWRCEGMVRHVAKNALSERSSATVLAAEVSAFNLNDKSL